MLLDYTHAELMQFPQEDVAKIALSFQDELKKLYMKLALSRATIADQQSSLKRKNHALRSVNRRRRSLTQTVVRRRKHGK